MDEKIKKLLLLSWKKVGITLLIWILSVFLHNLISGLFGIEEAVFFTIAVPVIPAYLLIAGIYSTVRHLKDGSKS